MALRSDPILLIYWRQNPERLATDFHELGMVKIQIMLPKGTFVDYCMASVRVFDLIVIGVRDT